MAEQLGTGSMASRIDAAAIFLTEPVPELRLSAAPLVGVIGGLIISIPVQSVQARTLFASNQEYRQLQQDVTRVEEKKDAVQRVLNLHPTSGIVVKELDQMTKDYSNQINTIRAQQPEYHPNAENITEAGSLFLTTLLTATAIRRGLRHRANKAKMRI